MEIEILKVEFRLDVPEDLNKFGLRFYCRRIRFLPADARKGTKRMLDLGKLREREKGLLQKKAKLESDIARLQTQRKDAARRDDTRRKIVLGGVLLAAVEAGDISTESVARLVRTHIAERDRKLFDGGPFAVTENASPGATDSGFGSGENERA